MRTAETRGECWRCQAETGAMLVCARCGAVQPLLPELDLFAVLGLPRRLALDLPDLERRYHEASRRVHPDRHQTGRPREQELSLAASAAVNRAYRTLRDPVARGRYWLELHGISLSDAGAQVPPEIAAEVFETQEKLEEVRAAAGPAAEALGRGVRERIAARLATSRDRLVALYTDGNGGGPPLEELRRRLTEIAYLRTLLGDVDDALGEELRGTDHRH